MFKGLSPLWQARSCRFHQMFLWKVEVGLPQEQLCVGAHSNPHTTGFLWLPIRSSPVGLYSQEPHSGHSN